MIGHEATRPESVRSDTPDVITADGLTMSFGGVTALSNVSIAVRPDELLAVIGPNGAGKTSLMNCLSGFYRPQKGQIEFGGKPMTGRSVHEIARAGLARTFQGTHVFPGMTVIENIMVGRHMHMKSSVLQAFIHLRWAEAEETQHREVAEEIIELLEIEAIRHQPVGSLGYGLRKRVDLGRALAQEPKVLLMDEPMAGMNNEEKEDLARFILDVREARGIPVVLVEHDMGVVMDLADRIYVLDFGKLIAVGPPEQIQRDPIVMKAYLGES